MVRSIITLGSPFANDIRATNATKLYEALSGEGIDDIPRFVKPLPATWVPATSDLFPHRRHRELAHQPVAAIGYR
jgi:hypothetical protein